MCDFYCYAEPKKVYGSKIDGYAEGYLDKAKAKPRIRRFKERLQALEAQAEQVRAQARQQADLQLIIGRLEEFSAKVPGEGLCRFKANARITASYDGCLSAFISENRVSSWVRQVDKSVRSRAYCLI